MQSYIQGNEQQPSGSINSYGVYWHKRLLAKVVVVGRFRPWIYCSPGIWPAYEMTIASPSRYILVSMHGFMKLHIGHLFSRRTLGGQPLGQQPPLSFSLLEEQKFIGGMQQAGRLHDVWHPPPPPPQLFWGGQHGAAGLGQHPPLALFPHLSSVFWIIKGILRHVVFGGLGQGGTSHWTVCEGTWTWTQRGGPHGLVVLITMGAQDFGPHGISAENYSPVRVFQEVKLSIKWHWKFRKTGI